MKSLELDESFQAVKDIPWALEELKEIQRKAADGYQSIFDRMNELDDNGKSEKENEEARFGLEDEIKDVSIAAKKAQKDLLVSLYHYKVLMIETYHTRVYKQ